METHQEEDTLPEIVRRVTFFKIRDFLEGTEELWQNSIKVLGRRSVFCFKDLEYLTVESRTYFDMNPFIFRLIDEVLDCVTLDFYFLIYCW